jgi:hypothetical protein
MVSQENRTGLYVTVPIYFVLLAGAAYWAYRRIEHMKHEGVNDQVGKDLFQFTHLHAYYNVLLHHSFLTTDSLQLTIWEGATSGLC